MFAVTPTAPCWQNIVLSKLSRSSKHPKPQNNFLARAHQTIKNKWDTRIFLFNYLAWFITWIKSKYIKKTSKSGAICLHQQIILSRVISHLVPLQRPNKKQSTHRTTCLEKEGKTITLQAFPWVTSRHYSNSQSKAAARGHPTCILALTRHSASNFFNSKLTLSEFASSTISASSQHAMRTKMSPLYANI